MTDFKFDFAISYASENESLAESIAEALTGLGASVYFAPRYRSQLLGRSLSREFGLAFGPQTLFFVPIISGHYTSKDYPQYEWEIALKEKRKRKQEFILPLRIDDTPLIGLPMDVAYLNLNTITVQGAAQQLIAKLPTTKQLWPHTWVATFGLLIEEALEEPSLPTDAPKDYIALCDWLTDDLMRSLRTQGLEDLQFIEDARDGETLSIRVSFEWEHKNQPFRLNCNPWWEVLETLPYNQVY